MKKVLVLTVLIAVIGAARADDARYELSGLEQPGHIIVDEWGVPHIYADSHYDAFFLQGFNAARDRLWQIDTWRRRGLGQLSEVFGEAYVAQDRAARLKSFSKYTYIGFYSFIKKTRNYVLCGSQHSDCAVTCLFCK